jgi:hypothetical protein
MNPMPLTELPQPRSSTEETPDGLRITIPAPRSWLVVGFMSIWLCAWLFGAGAVIWSLFGQSGAIPETGPFILLWLAGWALGGGFIALRILWMAFGREVVAVSPSVLRLRREIFGIGRSREFDFTQVRNLRMAPQPVAPPAYGSGYGYRYGGGRALFAGGVIAFDYGSRTFRFGSGVDEAEAAQLVATIQERFRGAF